MATETIAKLLGDNAELGPLTGQLERIRRLQRRYRTLVPEQLAGASRVCAIDGKTVVICAASGPVAAVLRQLAPRLLEGLRASARKSSKHSVDQELNSIRLEVQVTPRVARRPTAPRAELPRDKLGAVARGLGDSELKRALERICAGQAKPKSR